MKKLISLLISAIMLFQLSVQVFASYPEEHTCSYETGNCTVTYTVQNEWDSYRQIEMSVTNNSEETLRNWALKLDCSGEVADIWNAEVCTDDGEIIVLRNCGYNYEIIPGNTVEFGFQLRGEDLKLPESVSLCNKTVDSTAGSEISYEITNNWDNGFIAEVSVTNNSDEPLEAWRLAFNGNFEITNLWNANKLYSENGFLVENDVTTIPIAKGETKKFGFQGSITPGETPEMTDFVLTSVVIDLNAEQPSNPDNPVDPDIPVDPDKPTDPDTPAEPDKPQEHIIMCFGEYSEEEKTLEVYWYSTDVGEISLYENTDNGGWTSLAENVEGESYKFEIEEDFLVKQIKAVQKTENGTLESEPFVVAHTEDGIVCTWLDSDSDGLADCVEEAYGTDTENPDTDGDGLTDYEEIFITGTNPLKYDTDENGINDAEDDTDGDGLSNKEEISLGTSVSSADTDEDDLSDYDELYKYNTDPLKADSDGDKLNDGEEIAIGLDPNNPETFGVPDAEYKVEQTISADSEVMSEVNTEESPYELSLEISATGNADTRLSASESTYSAVTDSDARLGGAVELRYLGGDVDKVKLTYKIADEYISNEGSEYAENCLDLQGIKRYNIFRYFDEINMLLPVATEFDEESNTLYAETDELGTYCVLDMEVLMRNFGIEPDELRDTKTFSRKMYSAATMASDDSGIKVVSATDNKTSDNELVYVTFIIDIRENGLTSEEFSSVKSQIEYFVKRAYLYERNLVVRLVTQEETNFNKGSYDIIGEWDSYEFVKSKLSLISQSTFEPEKYPLGEYCNISEALAAVVELPEKGERNYIFDIYAQNNVVFEKNTAHLLSNIAWENNINIGIITEYDGSFTGYQQELLVASSGKVYNDFENFGDSIYSFIWGEDVIPTKSYPVILSTGYQNITLDSKLYPNGYWQGLNPDSDTDGDGLTDWDEVKTSWLKSDGTDYILPTIREYMGGLKNFPSFLCFDGFEEILDCRILPIESNPAVYDSDDDGVDDFEESLIGTKPLNADTDGDKLNDGIEIALWFDPLNANPDGDSYNDNEEYANGTNPFVYDYSPWEYACEFNKGFWLGDWDTADNIPQLLGQIAGSFVPLVADARDYFANVFKNLDTGAALLNLGGFLIDFAPAAGATTDFIKAAPKLAKFVAKHSDDAPKVIDAVVQSSKQISNGDDALVSLAKSLDPKTIDTIADSTKKLDKVTKADFERILDALKSAGYNGDNLIGAVIKNADDYIPHEVIEKMRVAQKNFNEEGLIFAIESNFDMPYGKLLWFEIGNDNTGLKHIVIRNHVPQLGDKGISEEEIIPVLRDLLLNHKPLGFETRSLPGGHIRYDVYYTYKSNDFVVGIGDNGYIANFLPRKPK